MAFSSSSIMEGWGWTSGRGLGKSEDGIASAVKAPLKKCTSGVGQTSAWGVHWWETLYDAAAGPGTAEKLSDTLSDPNLKIPQQRQSAAAVEELYLGRFVRAKYTLTSLEIPEEALVAAERRDGEGPRKVRQDRARELYAACGGSTVKSYASSGKLARLAAQESSGLRDDGEGGEDQIIAIPSRRQEIRTPSSSSDGDSSSSDPLDSDEESTKSKKSKKAKKPKKSKSGKSTRRDRALLEPCEDDEGPQKAKSASRKSKDKKISRPKDQQKCRPTGKKKDKSQGKKKRQDSKDRSKDGESKKKDRSQPGKHDSDEKESSKRRRIK